MSFSGISRRSAVVIVGLVAIVAVVLGQSMARASDVNLERARTELATFGELLGTFGSAAELDAELPLAGLDPTEALTLVDVAAELTAALEALDTTDAAGFAAALDGLDGATYGPGGDVTVAVGGPAGGSPVVQDGADVIDVVFDVTISRQFDVPLDLETSVLDLLAVGSAGTFPVDVTLRTPALHFQFDKALGADPVTASQALSLRLLPDSALFDDPADAVAPVIDLDIVAVDVPLSVLTTDLGFTEVSVNGTISFDIGFDLALLDPDDPDGPGGPQLGDDVISGDEWSAIALADLVDIGLDTTDRTNVIAAAFTLDSTLISGTDDLVISYLDDLDDPAAPVITVPDADLLDFRNLTPDEALAAIQRLIGLLDGIQASGRVDPILPFVSGKDDPTNELTENGTFSDAVRLADALRSIVETDLAAPPDPAAVDPSLDALEPGFANIQELIVALQTALGIPDLGLDYDPATQLLTFDVGVSDDGAASVDIEFGGIDALSGVGNVTTAGNVMLDGDYDLGVRFGIDLSTQPTEGTGAGIGSCTDGVDNDEDGDLDAVDADCAGIETIDARTLIEVGTTAGTPELTARAGVVGSGLDAAVQIGMLEAGMSGGSIVVGSSIGEGAGGPGTCDDGIDNNADPDGLIDMADPACRMSVALDIVDTTGDGWLTIRELFEAMGDPAGGVEFDTTLDVGLDGTLPVSVTGVPGIAAGGDIVLTGTYTGDLIADPVAYFANFTVDTSDLEASSIFDFSPCANSEDDDGDGTVNDGCPGGPPAVDTSEASSVALFDHIIDLIRELSDELRGSGSLPAEFDEPLPLIGASFDDMLSLADELAALADDLTTPQESGIECDNAIDDDGDNLVNDGCPTTSPDDLPEADCADAGPGDADDDGDGLVNEGCPASIPSIQNLSTTLDDALTEALQAAGLSGSPDDDAMVDVSIEYSGSALILRLDVDPTISVEQPFSVDLPAPISDLVSLDGEGTLTVDLGIDLDLDVGIDLTDLSLFVLGSTGLSVSADASAVDTQFDAGVGPLTLQVGQIAPTAEAGADCANATDDDGDGYVNDGCPTVAGPAESGGDCTGGNDGEDDDGDGVADDGCGDAGDPGPAPNTPEDAAAGECDIADATDDDGDGTVNDGCPAQADRARAFIGGAFGAGVVGGAGDRVGLGSLSFEGTVDGAYLGGTAQTGCADVGPAGDKDACAVLPLYLDDSTPIGAAPDGHHVTVTIADLANPAGVVVDYDTTQLETLVAESVVDLLLVQTGLSEWLAAFTEFVDESLMGFDVPVLGDGLSELLDFIDNLDQHLVGATTTALQGGNPVDQLAPSTADVQTAIESVFAPVETALSDAGILTSPLVVELGCGDPGAPTPCDPGDAEDPADCANATDDDGDGTVNDGCDQVGTEGESGSDCNNAVDDDADTEVGDVNDGCPADGHNATEIVDVRISVGIGQTISDGIDADFDIGIPGLSMSGGGGLYGTAEWSLDLAFGVNKDVGFYVDTSDPDEFSAGASVQLTEAGAPQPAELLDATLGFLQLTATDQGEDGAEASSNISLDFSVDLLDPGPTFDDRLTIGELFSGPDFGDLIGYDLTAAADVNLHLETGFSDDAGLPRLVGDLHLDWTWTIVDSADPTDLEPGASCGAGDCLSISLDNLALDAGSFISNFLQPIFADISRFTKPFQPIINTLNEPIPVLSDLGDEPVTLLTLAETLGPADQNYDLIITIVRLIDFINGIADFNDGGNPDSFLIPLDLNSIASSSFSLDADRLQDRKLAASEARNAYEPSALAKVDGKNLVGDGAGINSKVGDTGSSEIKVSSLKDIGVSFPFLEQPTKLLGLLFGQDVDLVLWEPEPLSIGFSYSQKFGPIWAVPPVFLEVGGSVSITGTFGIGYDTEGFRAAFFDDQGPAGLLRGLFLIDRHPLDGGPDTNELELRGELFANAQVSVVIFSAGAEGSIFLTIGIDLQDPNGDGKLKFAEAADVIRSTGSVLCIFNLNGQFGVRISVFAEVDLFFWSERWTKTLAEIILFEFKVECEPLPEPQLAHVEGGDLVLHMGPNRHLRDPGDSGTAGVPDNSVGSEVTDEKFTVTRTGTGVIVSALGVVEEHTLADTAEIIADGGSGEDVITLKDGIVGAETTCATDAVDDDGDGLVNDGCPAAGPETPPAPETGSDCTEDPGAAVDDDGDGVVNDGCKTSGAVVPFELAARIDGGPGKDQITTRFGADTINGDAGAAVPAYDTGLDPEDLVDGPDLITAGDGANTLHGNGHDDQLGGGIHVDRIYGDGGNDVIDAGPGADIIEGNDGRDQIDGGRSLPATATRPAVADEGDTIDGGDGDDSIDGGDGGDTIDAGPGNDRVSGEKGDDFIDGGDETSDCDASDGIDGDVLVGGPGADTIDGEGGDDIVVGGNILAGQPDVGDLRVDGGPGCDVVIGDNALFTDATDPTVFEPIDPTIGGNDFLVGGDDADVIQGQIGDDVIWGDDAADSTPNDGIDIIRADDGADDVHAGGGADDVKGGIGNDDIVGGEGADTILGEAGEDVILGDDGSVDNGADLDNGSRADDSVVLDGETGVDIIRGGPDPDVIHGQGGGDFLFGDGGDDVVYGDGDDQLPADFSALDGGDAIFGGVGDDYLFGNNGADNIYGESGNDRMVGGSPNATYPDSGLTDGFQDRMWGNFGADIMAGDNATISAAGDVVLLAESTIGEADLILGEGADDRIFGENGDDLIYGGTGDDHVEGGDDDDEVHGGAGHDDLIGGTTQSPSNIGIGGQPDGDDELFGEGGADVILGDNGEVTRPGGTDGDGSPLRSVVLTDLDDPDVGLYGEDLLIGGMSGDRLFGGGQDDQLFGHTETDPGDLLDLDDRLQGNDGDDELYGHAGQDDLIGGTSGDVDQIVDADPAVPSDGDHPDTGVDGDTLYGYDGTDSPESGDHDVLAGDNATVLRPTDAGLWIVDDLGDRLDSDVVRRRVVLHDVATTTDTPSADTAGGDLLRGDDDHDRLYGQGGDDELHGGSSDDAMDGGDGADDLFGDAGQDDLVGGTGRTVSDDPTSAVDGRLDDGDDLFGGDGAGGVGSADDFDVLLGDNATVLRGSPFEDPLAGGAWTVNSFNAAVQRELYLYDVGTTGAPVPASTNGPDVLRGEADDDLMYGQGDGDDMEGAGGDDYMEGNEGADTMAGQSGNDDMVGGTGRINDDPDEGTDGRLDTGEIDMAGGDGFDVMAGDNAIIERVLDNGQWVPNTYNAGVRHEIIRLLDVATVDGPAVPTDVSGGDTMTGGPQDDVLYGQGNGDGIPAGQPDVINGNGGDDHIEGNAGDDVLYGDADRDDIVGGTGRINDDPADGTDGRLDGADLIHGQSDMLEGTIGGTDFDVIAGDNAVIARDLSDPSGEWIDNGFNGGVAHTVVLRDVEVSGEAAVADTVHGPDLVWGNGDDDRIWGQGGPDELYGGAGDDDVEGNHDRDHVYGGPGQDDLIGGSRAAGRLDTGDVLFGDGDADGDGVGATDSADTGTPWDHDVILGDNGDITRPLDGSVWTELTYRHLISSVMEVESRWTFGTGAVDHVRVLRVVEMLDEQPGDTSGSDLINGNDGDDELYGQFDDTDDGGAIATECDATTPLLGGPDGTVPVSVAGDLLCGEAGEDAVSGDQGVITTSVNTGPMTYNGHKGAPFLEVSVNVPLSLQRDVELTQIVVGGDDVVLGGPQHDSIHTGAGDDVANGEEGHDILFGADGADALWGGPDDDRLWGGYDGDFLDVHPRTAAQFPPEGDPDLWFAIGYDDPTTLDDPATENLEGYDGYGGYDLMYGGWHQDAMQANLGKNGPGIGDRMVDWAGAHNAYYLCPATYGERVSTRQQSPSLIGFMEAQAEADGAVGVTTGNRDTSSGYNEAGIVYKPDIKANTNPPHPDTPAHFTCDGGDGGAAPATSPDAGTPGDGGEPKGKGNKK